MGEYDRRWRLRLAPTAHETGGRVRCGEQSNDHVWRRTLQRCLGPLEREWARRDLDVDEYRRTGCRGVATRASWTRRSLR